MHNLPPSLFSSCVGAVIMPKAALWALYLASASIPSHAQSGFTVRGNKRPDTHRHHQTNRYFPSCTNVWGVCLTLCLHRAGAEAPTRHQMPFLFPCPVGQQTCEQKWAGDSFMVQLPPNEMLGRRGRLQPVVPMFIVYVLKEYFR